MIICIVDDHKLLGQSLKYRLTNAPNVTDVYLYLDAEQFLAEKFVEWQPDIVIADMLLPGMNAIEMIIKCKPNLPKTRFIILTSLINTSWVKEAFNLGIDGYLTKDASEKELLEALVTVRAGGRYVNHSMKDKLVEHLLTDKQPDYHLSLKEKEVLQQICSGSTPKEIASQMNLSVHTIQQFIRRIMRKMQVNRTTDLVVLAMKNGLYNPS